MIQRSIPVDIIQRVGLSVTKTCACTAKEQLGKGDRNKKRDGEGIAVRFDLIRNV